MPSMLVIASFLLALCWAVSGAPVGKGNANEYNLDTLLSQLPYGGYIISFGEDHRPFVYANLTGGSSNNTTLRNAQLAQKLPRTSDQWGCIVGETVDETCYDLAAGKLGQWCDVGNTVGRAIMLVPPQPLKIMIKSSN